MSDFIFCNKDEALACSKYAQDELKINESHASDLTEIAKSIARY